VIFYTFAFHSDFLLLSLFHIFPTLFLDPLLCLISAMHPQWQRMGTQCLWYFLCLRLPGEAPVPQYFWHRVLRKWNAKSNVPEGYISVSDL